MWTSPLSRRKCWSFLAAGVLALAGCSDSSKPGDEPGPGTDGPGVVPGNGSECLGAKFLSSLGKDKLLVGAQMEDATAKSAPFDVRYLYIAAGLFDSNDACTSCASGCTSGGVSCSNSGAGCGWWGCWQYDQEPPGAYVRDFILAAKEQGQIPFITYYEEFQASGYSEGEQQLAALNDASFLRRYLADWRFLLKQVGQEKVLLQIEPDLWAYLQFFPADGKPQSTPVAVKTANPTDCATQENNAAGLGKCMIAMARKYAPNAKVGLHASAWATKTDVSGNTDPSFNVAAEANKVADFLLQVGAADTDFVTVEASDRDAGWYEQTQGKATWWDPENKRLPHFQQAFSWAKAISARLNKPHLWWQLPLGNMSLSNKDKQWRDNRVDYYLTHPAEVAAAGGVGFLFGAGNYEQTTPETDGGNLVKRVKAYKDAGGQAACVP
ncbi:hypothetical protein [Corallococcus sicarius]|uniref:Uncharacterized protein n=1 Tax=Corallococcus sicarius TaxID=2316726 RepID=A0A3A8NXR4_9BACT|nr:hypothetical protein [Corallococcus sicarius]RKH48299.1 hypothetical protein D7X12_00665 [Corallococcus sicarius]